MKNAGYRRAVATDSKATPNLLTSESIGDLPLAVSEFRAASIDYIGAAYTRKRLVASNLFGGNQ
jgi:hypothetical protein